MRKSLRSWRNPLNKIDSYIGFSLRNGTAVLGLDKIEVCRKKIYLIVYSQDLKDNSLKKLTKYATLRDCPMITYDLSFLNRGCKAIGLCDANLAKAVLNVYKG